MHLYQTHYYGSEPKEKIRINAFIILDEDVLYSTSSFSVWSISEGVLGVWGVNPRLQDPYTCTHSLRDILALIERQEIL